MNLPTDSDQPRANTMANAAHPLYRPAAERSYLDPLPALSVPPRLLFRSPPRISIPFIGASSFVRLPDEPDNVRHSPFVTRHSPCGIIPPDNVVSNMKGNRSAAHDHPRAARRRTRLASQEIALPQEPPPASVYTPAILLLAAIVGGSFLGLGFIMPLRALYARSIGSTAVEIGLMTTAYLLASFLAAPFIGRLTDRLGPSRLLWIGLAGHALVVIAYINVHAPVLFLALRAAEGVTAAAVIPPARAMINRLAPASRQGEALGLLSAAQEAGRVARPGGGGFSRQPGRLRAIVHHRRGRAPARRDRRLLLPAERPPDRRDWSAVASAPASPPSAPSPARSSSPTASPA